MKDNVDEVIRQMTVWLSKGREYELVSGEDDYDHEPHNVVQHWLNMLRQVDNWKTDTLDPYNEKDLNV